MATVNFAYDHPQYNVHYSSGPVEIGGAANTAYGKWVAFTAMQVYSAQLTVSVAGTNTGARMAVVDCVKISGTSTSTLYSGTFGTSAAFTTTTNALMTSAAGGVALAAGDILQFMSGTDATIKSVGSFEVAVQKLGAVSS